MKKLRKQIYEMKKKEAAIGVLFSFFICGAGQIYAQKYAKGILLFFLSTMSWLLLLGWVVNIISMIMAVSDVEDYNKLLKLELKHRVEE